MAIATYSELLTELGTWLNRDTGALPVASYIRLFEARVNRELRSPDMEQTFTFSTVSGTLTYSLSSRVRELREVYASFSSDVDPILYSVSGETLVFASDPGDDVPVTYSGYVTLPALGTGQATNWLLDDHPDAYLYGSLAEAYAHLRDDGAAAIYKDLSDQVIASIRREANNKRLPAGPLQSTPAVRE
jgi:hypothetical protein